MSPIRRRGPFGAGKFETRSDPEWDFFVAGEHALSASDVKRKRISSRESKVTANGSGPEVSSHSSTAPAAPPAPDVNRVISELSKISDRLDLIESRLETQANEIRVPRLPEIPRYNRP